jgi:CHASE2 domain-containing sensor protein
MDFVMTQTKNAAYLSAMTPKQLEYIYGFPFWAEAVWGLGVWGGVLGSLALLFRRGLAVCLFLASLIGIVLTDLYNFVLSNGLEVMGGAGAVVFPAVIFVIGVLLWLYARAMRTRGVLR